MINEYRNNELFAFKSYKEFITHDFLIETFARDRRERKIGVSTL